LNESNILTHGIQLAIAPVFLLTAVAAMIAAVAGRLARIVDRARALEDRLEAGTAKNPAVAFAELERLARRGWFVNAAMALLTLCALLIGATVMALFLGETTSIHVTREVSVFFLSGIVSFIVALLFFFAETILASEVIRFGRHLARARAS
jgi:hypothetical protein